MIEFGSRPELLIDDYLIESKTGAAFVLNHPLEREKVLSFVEPWEGEGSLGQGVFDDDGTVKLYYRGFPTGASDLSPKQTLCLATSKDGINFERAKLNLIDYDGITDNDIVKMDMTCHNFAPFLDQNPNCDPSERYKAVGGLITDGGLFVFGSPDGIRWHDLAGKPVITKGAFDSMNTAFYDVNSKIYRCYSRYFDGVRAIQSCVSEDFLHWSDPLPNSYVGMPELTEHFYTNAARPIPGAEHILVSFPMRFMETRKKLESYPSSGISDAVFISSRDGVNWNRTFRESWIYAGLDEREWTQRNFITTSGIIDRGGEFSFYVEKRYMWDDCGIWRYSIPRYRFGSLHAGPDGGSFITKPLRFVSDSFHINYSTSAYGGARISVLDENGETIAQSGEIYGNELSREVKFDGIAGRCARLRFDLNDACIYAIGSEMNL